MTSGAFVTLLCALLLPSLGAESASDLVEASGVKGGLVVCAGEMDAAFLSGLRDHDSFLVQGLVPAGKVEALRKALAKAGLCGKITVVKHPGEVLPYVDNLVNLLIDADAEGSVAEGEIRRVLSPRGVFLSRHPFPGAQPLQGTEGWFKFTKPVSPEVDEWTHHLYDAAGINAGRDRKVGPPRHLQWKAGPEYGRSHENFSSSSLAVSANGRVFSIIDEGPKESIYLPSEWTLSARDAYSGMLLWKLPIESWHARLFPLKNGGASLQMSRRMVAQGEHVYATLGLDAPVSNLSAATGKILAVYEDTAHAEELLCVEGKLVVLCAREGAAVPYQGARPAAHPDFKIDEFVPKTESRRSVVVVEVKGGKTLWKVDVGEAIPLAFVSDGKIVSLVSSNELKALEMDTGRVLWSKKLSGLRPVKVLHGAPPAMLHQDVLYIGLGGSMNAFDAADGSLIWSQKWEMGGFRVRPTVLIAQGLIWNVPTDGEMRQREGDHAEKPNRVYTGHDLRTGEVVKSLPILPVHGYGVMHHRCHVPRASGDYLLTGFPGIEFFDMNSGDIKYNSWIRGACFYGFMPANGLIYTLPHPCACYAQAKVSGYLAVAGSEARSRRPERDVERLEKGPGYGKMPNPEVPEGPFDWPTYRGEGSRSGKYAGTLSPEFKSSWSAALGGKLTQPVIAEGKVFVASVEEHRLYALEADHGTVVWESCFSARIDSAPTYYKRMLLFGCRDGYVYNLNASDGTLNWRFLGTPEDLSAVVYDQLESVWPIHGSVLIKDDEVWFSAGRTSFLDGGIHVYRLDPFTGREVFRTNVLMLGEDGSQPPVGVAIMPDASKGPIGSRLDLEGAKAGILSTDGTHVFMRHYTFDSRGEKATQEIDHLFTPTGFLDDTWFRRTYWIYGNIYYGGAQGWAKIGNERPTGRILSVGKDRVYGFGRDKYPPSPGVNAQMYRSGEKEMFFSIKKEAKSPARKQRNMGLPLELYEWTRKGDLQTRGMLLSGDEKLLLVAGAKGDWIISRDALEGKLGSVLRVMSADDGKTVAEYELPAPPVQDGLSAANGNLYVSLKDGSVACFRGK